MRKSNSTTDDFFAVQKEKSRVKTLIVTEFLRHIFLSSIQLLEKIFGILTCFVALDDMRMGIPLPQ